MRQWTGGRWAQSAEGCAFAAARRKNVARLAPADVRDEAMKRAGAWVGRRQYASERARTCDLLTYAEQFYAIALDYIGTCAKEAGDRERREVAWHLCMHVGFWQAV